MFLFILFILSCLSDNSLVHEIETIEYETITEIEYVYVEDTAPPPQDTSLNLLPIWVDSFTQPNSVNGVDIIWVIDRSGSMHDEATQITLGIETMMNALPQTQWRLVMINISSMNSANHQDFPLIPGDTLADAQAMYAGLGGSGREEGFKSLQTYIQDNPYSSTWMRNDAALLVVFVSDEDDQSGATQLNPYPLSDFTNWLLGYRSTFHVTSIVHLPPAESQCNNNTTAVGDRYIDATNFFGGTVVDICTSDWSAGITEASLTVEPYEHYQLTKRVKYPQYLQVFYNGSPAHPDEWRFDSVTNTIWFNRLPAGGVLVEIAYYYQSTH
mgnify:FL=1|tara:strand:+ start:232 stop:1212 length:981 start_codon:yes stop_codon:yes gene_type:complete